MEKGRPYYKGKSETLRDSSSCQHFRHCDPGWITLSNLLHQWTSCKGIVNFLVMSKLLQKNYTMTHTLPYKRRFCGTVAIENI